MNFPPVRKSLFFAEKQYGPGSPGANLELPQDNQPITEHQPESHHIPPDHNSHTELPSLQSSMISKSPVWSRTAFDETKSFIDSVSSLAAGQKTGQNSPGQHSTIHRRFQAAIQVNGQDINPGAENTKPDGIKRPTPLTIKRQYLGSPSNDNDIVPVFEDEKEDIRDSPCLNEGDQTFFSDTDLVSELSDEDDDEEQMDPERRLRRKRLRKIFYASYFVGIAISLQNRIRLYGTLKPIEETKRPEDEIKVTKKKSILVKFFF